MSTNIWEQIFFFLNCIIVGFIMISASLAFFTFLCCFLYAVHPMCFFFFIFFYFFQFVYWIVKDYIKQNLSVLFIFSFLQFYSKDDPCAICLHGGPMVTFGCSHHFHKDCIIKWMEKGKNQCPLCRQGLVWFPCQTIETSHVWIWTKYSVWPYDVILVEQCLESIQHSMKDCNLGN